MVLEGIIDAILQEFHQGRIDDLAAFFDQKIGEVVVGVRGIFDVDFPDDADEGLAFLRGHQGFKTLDDAGIVLLFVEEGAFANLRVKHRKAII